MNLFFPQVGAAIVVRRTRPQGARFLMGLGKENVYLIETDKRPRGCKVAGGSLGGWNYSNGVCIGLVYAHSFSALTRFCEKEGAEKLVKTRRLENGMFCNIIRTQSGMPISIGCTPILAEQELAEDE